MRATASSPRARVIRLNPNGYARLCAVNGWNTTEAAARVLGVASTTITRALREETAPGGALLAQILAASRAAGMADEEILDVAIVRPSR